MTVKRILLIVLFPVLYSLSFASGEVTIENKTNQKDLLMALESIDNSGTIILKSIISITKDLIIPEKVALFISKEGGFNISDHVTLTINGSIQANLYKIFYLHGKYSKINGNPKIEKVYPHWWGATQNDLTNDDAGIQGALNFILNRTKASTRIQINNAKENNAFVTLDLAGGEFLLNHEIILPETSTYIIANGIVKASNTFSGKYLFNTYIDSSEYRFTRENVHFKNTILNCNYKCGGIKLANAIRWIFDNFSVFNIPGGSTGLFIHSQSNEIMVSNSFFINSDYQANSIGIKLEHHGKYSNSDHHFNNIIIQRLEYGILSNGSTANVFDRIHIYGTHSNYGIKLIGNTSANRITNCHFDGCKLNIQGPSQSLVSNCYFLYTDSDSDYAPFEIEANWKRQYINGFIVTNNIFRSSKPIEAFKIIENSNYYFDHHHISDTYIKDNISQGNVHIRGTEFTKKYSIINSDRLLVNFSDQLLLGNCQEYYLGITNTTGDNKDIITANVTELNTDNLTIKFNQITNATVNLRIITSKNNH